MAAAAAMLHAGQLECWNVAASAAAANELVSDDDPLGFSLAVVEQLPSLDLLNRIRLTTST